MHVPPPLKNMNILHEMVHFGTLCVYNGVLGVELPARSRGRARGSGDEAESFEAIVHLKEGPKLA